jgi:hypothetical protein
MAIEKLISFHIERQFPAIYREQGRELVEFVKEYYRFLETNDKQSVYNGRRLFEYRDIDTTLQRMLIFFQKKYLADLPFEESTLPIIVKNILDLYRRKGTEGGLEIFFRLFYGESIKVYYPARDILKPSDSVWRKGSYLQLYSNDGLFTSTRTNKVFTYADIVGKEIIGSASRATAIVDKINFIIINQTIVPILFIINIGGTFIGLEDIICEIDGIPVLFGRIDGSLTDVTITQSETTGNEVGDIVTITSVCASSFGAKGIVTEVTESFTGIVEYTIEDGGWGYSVDSTRLLVSNQIIFLDNTGGKFEVFETLEDTFGNRGIVIGQNDISVGIRMEPGDEFANVETISTADRDVNVTLLDLSPTTEIRIVSKNETSPGDLYPDTLDTNDVLLSQITNTETVSLIFDLIEDFANVTIDALDYNDPPALIPMSGSANTVTSNTALDEAFDLTPVQFGSIVSFANIDPGIDYVNDVFAIAVDSRMTSFERRNRFVTLENIPATLGVGSVIEQGSVSGKVTAISGNTLTVLPYTYFGFDGTTPITFGGQNWNVVSVTTDFTSPFLGFNSTISTSTEFAIGRILDIDIIDSGYGYADGSAVNLINSEGNIAAIGIAQSRGQGTTGGFWSTLNSHLNGYLSDGSYFDGGKRIQDSDFYQEYSYQILSTVEKNRYEESLKSVTHVAGTKIFDRFNLEQEMPTPISALFTITR